VLGVLAAGPPDAAGLDHPLWTRRAVSVLVGREAGLCLSPTTVGHYLTRWGLSAEAVARRGPEPGGASLPGGWSGRPRGRERLRVAWTRPAPDSLGALLLGGPPEVLLATSNRGASAFLLATTPFTAAQAADFGERLFRQVGRGVHLVVSAWPAEHAGILRAWAGSRPGDGPVRVSTY
jgi:hypothetical protein